MSPKPDPKNAKAPSDPVAAAQQAMSKVLETFKEDLRSLRAGRVVPGFLDKVKVDVYGSSMQINQVANISVADHQTLLVQVWDRGNAGSVEKAIRTWDSSLAVEDAGGALRVRLPAVTSERRAEIVKMAAKLAEKARISLRSCRHEALDALKANEKEGAISEDDLHQLSKKIQKVVDQVSEQIEAALESKKKDILDPS